jgi:hypothetical protein
LLCEAISPPVLEDSSGMRIRLLIVKKRIRVLSVSPRHLRFPFAPVASDARPGLNRRRSSLSQGSSCLHFRVKGHSSKGAASTVELSGCRLSTLRHHSFPACREPHVKTTNTPITSLASRGNVEKRRTAAASPDSGIHRSLNLAQSRSYPRRATALPCRAQVTRTLAP